MATNKPFSFEISLSILNHLGRNLYRSFVTVIGEAISNSWDADAKNVWIYIDKSRNRFIIKDDGDGMIADDFQNKFLRIGYSKRIGGRQKSASGRPFIGRKGIGKLALLSCAKRITILSKIKGKSYVGGVIDNTALDAAITSDFTPKQYQLGIPDRNLFRKYSKGHQKGTIICFEEINGGIRNSLDILKKVVALYFRFSLLDKAFNIYIDGIKITHKHLQELADKTEFVWQINNINDPFIHEGLKGAKRKKKLSVGGKVKGFIASVIKPRDLNIMNTDERVGVDLYVNGRLRERGILKHIPSARLVESYLYGQIHLNELDDKEKDRFTSDREGVVSDDPKYQALLTTIKDEILKVVIDDWDKWRVEFKETGDAESERISKKERTSRDLYNAVSDEYSTPPTATGKKSNALVNSWVDELADDASFNFQSYAECFISENLIRKFIQENKKPLSKEAKLEIDKWKRVETDSKNKGNISIEIRRKQNDSSYLSMNDLAYLVDKKDPVKEACLARDANEYKPMRDAVAHTALLTDVAKLKLTSIYENIKGRVNKLLSKQP
ncbi:MAG: ATP-binding protein [Bacteroidetes bacterium]|nr:ATP-binding protein [Bacteroidota bacterium]